MANKVQKLDHRTHILKLPDTYIGSVEKTTEDAWVFNVETGKIQKKLTNFIPGEYKIFDEIIVNAFDQYIRLNSQNTDSEYPVKNIWININPDTGEIQVKNDGIGISIEKHEKEGVWIPELIFGHLLTSSNYSKDKIKHVGGKNGYGAKLANIYSTNFYLETVDHVQGKKYRQEWKDNMSITGKPSITKNSTKPYTIIRYTPDYKRFGLENLEPDMFQIMHRRAYDLAACTGNKVAIHFNTTKLNCKTFDQYVNLYLDGDKSSRVYEKVNDRWEIVVGINPYQQFEQVSFVNGIFTNKGGKHVDYVLNQVTKKLAEWITKKKKINVKPVYIRDNIVLFVNALIDNPSFNSQTKECLTTAKEKFGSKCDVSDKFITALSKTGIVERVIELASMKENKQLKKNDGKKSNRVRDLPKLEDANFAGHKTKSRECTLILTEGDSAKATAMAGLAVVGRDRYGVFPLKGKPPNVKDASNQKKLNDNTELNSIKKALGLQAGKEYSSVDDLRYGKIMILSDQDEDGTHIKGLVFNMFHSLWPTLYKNDGFLNSMLTPVIKAKKGSQKLQFYSVKDYEKWKETSTGNWHVKYYKGLGTSTPQEAREYFKELKIVNYGTAETDDELAINLAFAKEKDSASHRKDWLKDYSRDNTIDYTSKSVSIKDFIDRDLIHFSNSDNIRSIPSVIDGLKPSQRKILYCCFKKNLHQEIRVAQLAGYVSENGAYHHGEASLQGAIVNMAQDFVGSNNINLLQPVGQFGTRIQGGKDAAQSRYIHTLLSDITTKIFEKSDNPLLKYNDEDGVFVEPIFYVPTLPMLLVNGSSGIGTGWSTDIPSFNPTDLIENMKLAMDGKPMKQMVPYYKGFKGKILPETNDNLTFKTCGKYEAFSNKLVITELPIGVWTQAYKEHLESLQNDDYIRYYNSYCTDVDINFEIFWSDKLQNLYDSSKEKFEKKMKITSSISCKNLVAFNSENKLTKYKDILEMLDEYIKTRIGLYTERRAHVIKEFNREINLYKTKVRFIESFINDKLKIIKKRKAEIESQLVEQEFPKVDNSYDYLLKMPIYSLSLDKIDELNKKISDLENSLEIISSKSEINLWHEDLQNIQIELDKNYGEQTKKVFKLKKKGAVKDI
jgi:DNA topoisomerase-2